MPPVGFEPTISAGERPQTYAMDRAAIGTGRKRSSNPDIYSVSYITRFLTVRHDIQWESEMVKLSGSWLHQQLPH